MGIARDRAIDEAMAVLLSVRKRVESLEQAVAILAALVEQLQAGEMKGTHGNRQRRIARGD